MDEPERTPEARGPGGTPNGPGTVGTDGKPGAGRGPDGAPPIVSHTPGSFPYTVWHDRHPALFARLRDAFPYGRAQRHALDALLEETLHGVIEPLPGTAHDHALWSGPWDRGHYGRRWTDAPFLWAESYFYRRLLGAVGYFGPGAWQGVDPFAPSKDAELTGDPVEEELAALGTLDDATDEERTDALLLAALWGNRADLGFLITAGDARPAGTTPSLVADDRALLHDLLKAAGDRRGHVAVVADNAGRELIPDLVLADHLLTTGRAGRVTLYVKPHPYYVSDATTADVLAALRRLVRASGRAGTVGGRLWEALGEDRLTVRTHPFFCAPLPYADLPDDLRRDVAASAVTILKGDLNYRRLVGDCHWPAMTPFAQVSDHFPAPVVALRTLKSDVVTGLAADTLATLDASGEEWRTTGAHALIQVRP